MCGPVIIVERSKVRADRLQDVRRSSHEVVAAVEEQATRVILYNVYLDESGSALSVIQVHPDATSAQERADADALAFADLADLERIEVYGEPGEGLLGTLRHRAETLGNGQVEYHRLHAGFAKFESRTEEPAR